MEKDSYKRKEGIFFVPHVLLDLGIVTFILFAILLGLAVFLPAELPEKADPTNIPTIIKPEWYLIFLYQFYKILPLKILFIKRVVLFGIFLVSGFIFSLLLPFLDLSEYRSPIKRPFFSILGLITIAGIILLTILGSV